MTYYLGRAGGLTALPDPEVGLPTTPERIGGTHQLLSGNRVRDTIGRMRTWNLSWTAIDLTTFGTLNSFFSGSAGPGPFYFFDPEQRNLLPPNVASGGDYSGDLTGFTVGAHLSGASVSTQNNSTPGGQYSIQVGELTTVVAFQDILVGPMVPVVASVAYSFGMDFWFNTGTPMHYALLQWFDKSQVAISFAPDGTHISATGYSRSTGTGTAPSNAAYAQLSMHTGTANTSGGTVFNYTDGWQIEQASAASAWVPGLGVPLVTVESLPRSTPLTGICDAQMTLVQVG